MEFVNQTESWIENIQHCVQFDSWNQFLLMGDGLKNVWEKFSFLTWGCKVESTKYMFQIVYINIHGPRQDKEKSKIIPAFGTHLFELKCVEFLINENEVPAIREWLQKKNPDLWKMNFLNQSV